LGELAHGCREADSFTGGGRGRGAAAAASSNMNQRPPEPEHAASTQITDEDIPF
jgi:hypothetical protein